MPQRRSARRWWPAMLVAGLALLGIAGGVATELLGGLVPDVWVQENRGLVIGSFAVIGLAGIVVSLLLWRAERPIAEPPPDPAGPGSTGVEATVEVGHNVGEVAGIKADAVMQADHGAQVGQQQTAGRDLGTAQTHGQAAPAIGINYGHITIQAPADAPNLAAGPAAVADQSDRGSGQPPALVVGALPPYPPHFVGRTDVLDRLHQQLIATQGQPTAIVAAHGLGGIGKTALAVAYAYHHHTDYELIGWIPADTRLTIAAGLAALAPPLGVTVAPDQEETVAAVLAELRRRDRWLLLFDNADDPADLLGRLPTGGRGRILVTSRNPTWADLAHRLEVEVLDPAAAAELLLAHTGDTDEGAARSVAEALGWLPLALQQAGAYIAATPGCTLAGYLTRYEQARTALLAQHPPVGYPESVATTWQLNFDTLANSDPAAVQLLRLCAFLAPDAIPLALLTADPAVLPNELGAAVSGPLGIDEPLQSLYRFSLVGEDPGGIRVHRLVQAVTRDHLPAQEAIAWAERAAQLLLAVFPSPAEEPAGWPQAAVLLPHVVAATQPVGQADSASPTVASLLNRAGVYLTSRGELPAARQILGRALDIAEQVYGPNRREVASILGNLGSNLLLSGELPAARQILERALHIEEAVYGPNHREVARTMGNLGLVLRDLGELPVARQTLERALDIAEQVYGPNHYEVARTMGNLGSVLLVLGELADARQTLERALVLAELAYGPNHREVAIILGNLGLVLRHLGELPAARQAQERALDIAEQVYGPNHYEVASILGNLGNLLRDLGDLPAARQTLTRALGIFRATLGDDHPRTKQAQRILDGLPGDSL